MIADKESETRNMNEQEIRQHITALEALEAQEAKLARPSRQIISAKEQHIIPLRKAGWRQVRGDNGGWVWVDKSAK